MYLFSCLSLPSGRYFDEISQDTGKYCFGVEDTLKALEMGAVEILIVYENLDTMRYILRVHGAECNGAENGNHSTYAMTIVAENWRKIMSCSTNLHVLWYSDEKTLYLTPEQEKDKSHFTDKEVSATDMTVNKIAISFVSTYLIV